jgi:putative sigma-54 modulation protein
MNLAITARKFKLKDDLRSYIEEKSNRLSRYYDNIIDTEVILGWEKQQRFVELKIKVDNSLIVVKEYSENLRKAFDLLLDKAERQLKRHKAKSQNKDKDIILSA